MTDLLTPKEELVLLAKELGIPFPTPTPYTLCYTRLLLHNIKEWMKREYRGSPSAEMCDYHYRDIFFYAKIESCDGGLLWGHFNSFETAYIAATLSALRALKEYPKPDVPLSIKVYKIL